MRHLTASDRSSLIRLASSMERGSQERREILRFLVAAKPLEEQEFTHPETKNKVKFTSLPKEEQAKIRAQMKKDEKGDDAGLAKKLSGWLDKAKGLTDKAKKRVQELPADAQKFVADPEYRKEALTGAAKAIKEAPGKYYKEVKHHFKHEIEEIGGGLKRMSQGKLPTKSQAKAMAGMAVELSVAALSIKTAGAFGAGVSLGKSLGKHLALSAINPLLGDAYVFGLEGSHLLHAVEGALHIAAEKGSTDPDKFVEDMLLAIADEMEKGISDEVLVKVLNGDDK